MKLASAVLALATVGTAVADGNMAIRGDSKGAIKLFKEARRLQNNNYYNNNGQYYNNQNQQGGGDEENSFLGAYSLKLISCIQGERFYGNEGGDEAESSTVVFRLCPVDSCNSDGSWGCQGGYGDYTVGLNTFMEAYMENQQQMQEQQQQYYQNNGNYNGNGDYNPYMYYDNNGEEFNVEEYQECSEYEIDEEAQQNYNYQQNYNNGQQNYNNGQQNYNNQGNYNQYQNNNNNQEDQQWFIGPACSADGTSVRLALFTDEDCYYQSDTEFEYLSNGWTMPYSDGGLVGNECIQCMAYNDNGEQELSRMCEEMYENAGARCEAYMEYTGYYGPNTNGCDYIGGMVTSVLGSMQESVAETVEEVREGKVTPRSVTLIVVLLALLGACGFGIYKATASTEKEEGAEYQLETDDKPKGSIA